MSTTTHNGEHTASVPHARPMTGAEYLESIDCLDRADATEPLEFRRQRCGITTLGEDRDTVRGRLAELEERKD